MTALTAIFSNLWEIAGPGGLIIVFLAGCTFTFAARNTFLHGYSFKPISARIAASTNREMIAQTETKNCDVHIIASDIKRPPTAIVTLFFWNKTRVHSVNAWYEDKREPIEFDEHSRNDRGVILDIPALQEDRMFVVEITPDKRLPWRIG